jgi:hypothetical protein
VASESTPMSQDKGEAYLRHAAGKICRAAAKEHVLEAWGGGGVKQQRSLEQELLFRRKESKERVRETNEQNLEWRMEKGCGIIWTRRQSSEAHSGCMSGGGSRTVVLRGHDN